MDARPKGAQGARPRSLAKHAPDTARPDVPNPPDRAARTPDPLASECEAQPDHARDDAVGWRTRSSAFARAPRLEPEVLVGAIDVERVFVEIRGLRVSDFTARGPLMAEVA